MQTLLSNVRFEEMVAQGSRGAGTSDINGAAVDMKGYEGCLIRVEMGSITSNAVTSLKAQEADIATGANANWTDITGASITIDDDDDNKYVSLDVANVRKRYFRGVLDRGTANAAIRSAQYIKYNPSYAKTAQPDDDLTLITTPS